VRQGAFGSQILGIGTPDLALKVLLANGHTRIYTKGVGAESGARGKRHRRMSYCGQARCQADLVAWLRDFMIAKCEQKTPRLHLKMAAMPVYYNRARFIVKSPLSYISISIELCCKLTGCSKRWAQPVYRGYRGRYHP